jgi:RNA polymerase sigma factor (sigma-70 family)
LRFLKSKTDNSKGDNELIADYRQTRNGQCIEILFNRYCHLAFAVCMKYLHSEDESKDAVIEVFEKIGKDLLRYEVRDFGSWLHTVSKNHCFHLLKKKKQNIDIEEESPVFTQSAVTEYLFEKSAGDDKEEYYMRFLNEALITLAEEQRICVELFYLQEKSYEEIEKSTGYSYNQVKSYIQNGKRNLKIYLIKKGNG